MLTCSMKSSVLKTVACYFSAVFSRYSSRKTFFVVHQVVVSCKSIALYFVHVTLVVRLFRLRITPETSCYLLQLYDAKTSCVTSVRPVFSRYHMINLNRNVNSKHIPHLVNTSWFGRINQGDFGQWKRRSIF